MCNNWECHSVADEKAELEEWMSPRLPDPEKYVLGPSLLGLAEQRNKILNHLKKQGVEVPKHLASPPLDELPLTRQDPSLHMTLLLIWVGQQGILLPPDLYKTRPPISHKNLPKDIVDMIKAYGPFEDRIRYPGYENVRQDIRRAYRCTHALRLSALNCARWDAYNAERKKLRER